MKKIRLPVIIILLLAGCTPEVKKPSAPLPATQQPKEAPLPDTTKISKPVLWPFVKYKEARAYVYNCLTDEPYGNIIQNGRLGTEVANSVGIKLTEGNMNYLNKVLDKKRNNIESHTKCEFQPHHGVVYYDSSGKPVAHISICFQCDQIHFEPKNDIFDTDNISLLKPLFTRNGMPVEKESYADYYYRFHPKPAKKDTIKKTLYNYNPNLLHRVKHILQIDDKVG